MKKIPFTKSMQEEHKKTYNPKKILQEIEREIEEKGFSIFEVDEQKRLEFLYYFSQDSFSQLGEKQTNVGLLFLIFLSILTAGGIGYLDQGIKTGFIASLFMGIYIVPLFFFKLKIDKISTPFPQAIIGIKDKYIFITTKYIFFNNTFHTINGSTWKEGGTIYNAFFKNSDYYYQVGNQKQIQKKYKKIISKSKKQNNIYYLTQTLTLLEKYFEYSGKLEEKIIKEIKEIQGGSFDFSEANYYIRELQTTIKNALSEKDIALSLLQDLHFEQYVDFTQFHSYLKKRLSFALKGLKYILKNHIFVIEELKKQNKNIDSQYIALANKRLEIYKTNLNSQIQLLEKEIEKLKS